MKNFIYMHYMLVRIHLCYAFEQSFRLKRMKNNLSVLLCSFAVALKNTFFIVFYFFLYESLPEYEIRSALSKFHSISSEELTTINLTFISTYPLFFYAVTQLVVNCFIWTFHLRFYLVPR